MKKLKKLDVVNWFLKRLCPKEYSYFQQMQSRASNVEVVSRIIIGSKSQKFLTRPIVDPTKIKESTKPQPETLRQVQPGSDQHSKIVASIIVEYILFGKIANAK